MVEWYLRFVIPKFEFYGHYLIILSILFTWRTVKFHVYFLIGKKLTGCMMPRMLESKNTLE